MAVHFTGPVLNAVKTGGSRQWFTNSPVSGGDPDYFTYFNDFINTADYAAADWVITTTEAGGSSATEALAADELGGALLITNDTNDNDSDSLQLNEETFSLTAGKRTWFETRIKHSNVDDCDVFVGLCITDTTPLDTTDRVGFQLAEGSAVVAAITEKNSTETNTATSTLADATYVKLGFYYDGVGKVEFYVNRALVATHTTNIPDDENLCVTIHTQNGAAEGQTLHIDYIYCKQER